MKEDELHLVGRIAEVERAVERAERARRLIRESMVKGGR